MAYSRKIQAIQYEPIGLSFSIEYGDEMTDDQAYQYIKEFVDGKLQEGLDAMGVRRVII